jgi:hypothetical protein
MKMATGPLLGVDGNEHVSETDVMLNMRGYLRWMGHRGFRPLQERPMKTDISVFAPLLKNPAPSGPLEPTPVQEPTPDKVPELEPTS